MVERVNIIVLWDKVQVPVPSAQKEGQKGMEAHGSAQ